VGVRAEDRARERELEDKNRRQDKSPASNKDRSRRETKPDDKTSVEQTDKKAKGLPKDKAVVGKSKEQSGASERTHTDRESAHKGIAESLREARRKKSLCTRCGKPNHWWGECRGQIIVAGMSRHARSRISEISPEPEQPQGKRKASEPPEQEENKKRSKVSAAFRYANTGIFDNHDGRI
jgi:hypothetical protein